jgi:4-amino-4-deoxy-L-arabinose transferase-like glycosyltransferase
MQFLKRLRIDIIAIVILILTSSFFGFYNLGKQSLRNWDEAIYAQIGVEFISHPSLLTTYNGALWLDKPPLGIWVQSLGLLLFGYTNFGIRFFGSLFFVGSIAVFFLLVRKVYDRNNAFLAALALLFCGSLYYPHMIRSGDLEQLYLFLTLGSFWVYVESWERPRLFWVVGLLAGLSFMARGYIAILTVVVIFLHVVITKLYTVYGRKRVMAAIGMFTVIVLPWHLYAFIANPSFFLYHYLGYQTLSRMSTPLEGHVGTWSFYLQGLINMLGRTMVVSMLCSGIYLSWLVVKYQKRDDMLWWLWLFVYGIALQTMATKINWYIVPVLPALYIVCIPLVRGTFYFFKGKFSNWATIFGLMAYSFAAFFWIQHAWNYVANPVVLPLDVFDAAIQEQHLAKQPIIIYHLPDMAGPALDFQWHTVKQYTYYISDDSDIQKYLPDPHYNVFITDVSGANKFSQLEPNLVWNYPSEMIAYPGGEQFAKVLLTKSKNYKYGSSSAF